MSGGLNVGRFKHAEASCSFGLFFGLPPWARDARRPAAHPWPSAEGCWANSPVPIAAGDAESIRSSQHTRPAGTDQAANLTCGKALAGIERAKSTPASQEKHRRRGDDALDQRWDRFARVCLRLGRGNRIGQAASESEAAFFVSWASREPTRVTVP